MAAATHTKAGQDQLGRPIESHRAWRSEDIAPPIEALHGDRTALSDVDRVATRLTPEEVQDLESVARSLPDDCEEWIARPLETITTQRLTNRFGEIAQELGHGRGFALIRGLDENDPELFRRMFWILGNHLGSPVMQNARGEVLSEVFDRFEGAPRGIDSRGYESNDELRFHCDGGDCIGLGCVRQSPSGGESGLVSLPAIYNTLLKEYPEHLDTLYRGFPLYVRREAEGDGGGTREATVADRSIPVFATQEGVFSSFLNKVLVEHAATAAGKPMDRASTDALNRLEEIAERPELRLRFVTQPGDVLWIHNHSVMHRRDLYQDGPDPKQKRLFYRMWTNLHEPRPLVRVHAGLRAGIRGPKPVIVGPDSERSASQL